MSNTPKPMTVKEYVAQAKKLMDDGLPGMILNLAYNFHFRQYETNVKRIADLESKLGVAIEALESVASPHVKIKDIMQWCEEELVEAVVADTELARKALEKLK